MLKRAPCNCLTLYKRLVLSPLHFFSPPSIHPSIHRLGGLVSKKLFSNFFSLSGCNIEGRIICIDTLPCCCLFHPKKSQTFQQIPSDDFQCIHPIILHFDTKRPLNIKRKSPSLARLLLLDGGERDTRSPSFHLISDWLLLLLVISRRLAPSPGTHTHT